MFQNENGDGGKKPKGAEAMAMSQRQFSKIHKPKILTDWENINVDIPSGAKQFREHFEKLIETGEFG